ncbi:hypothetical protein ACFWOJ_35775 [Streptomyces sp. NPDC058439]|uniref:hypothetical protein n=1 Tax=Streptomyces sp. NPDC058439 TaxID=3346500 RepID=UPI00365155A9
MVPLINGADRTLRWFIEDVWGQFDDNHTRPGAPLFPFEHGRLLAPGRRRRPARRAQDRGQSASAGMGRDAAGSRNAT